MNINRELYNMQLETMIGDTTHYLCEHNLRVQVSPFVYICLDMLYNYKMNGDIMYMYMINKLLLYYYYWVMKI